MYRSTLLRAQLVKPFRSRYSPGPTYVLFLRSQPQVRDTVPQDQVMEFPMEPEFGLKSQILNVSLVRISRSDCSNKQCPNISDLTQEKKIFYYISAQCGRLRKQLYCTWPFRDTFGAWPSIFIHPVNVGKIAKIIYLKDIWEAVIKLVILRQL